MSLKFFSTHQTHVWSIEAIGRLLVDACLLVTALCMFVPFLPWFPSEGLDSSWVLGMNQAVAQRLSIGSDLIFTFGPYASIYTRQYHPASDTLMLAGGAYLGLSYWLGMRMLIRGRHIFWGLVLIVVLASFGTQSADARLLSYPLLVAFVCPALLRRTLPGANQWRLDLVLVGVLFSPIALLFLIKGTLILLGASVILMSSIYFVTKESLHLALSCLVAPALSALVFWAAGDQPLSSLPAYLISTISIISGYTEAMSVFGRTSEIVAFIASATLSLGALLLGIRNSERERVYLGGILSLFLFVSFKAGFIRHDAHAILGACALVMATVMLGLILTPTKLLWVALASSLGTGLYVEGNYIKHPISQFLAMTLGTYQNAWIGLRKRVLDKSWPTSEFAGAMQMLKRKANFPVLAGSTDIYPFDQAYLIASGNRWNPRPIFQSYSVYTPELCEKNRAHLFANGAPDNVIFKVAPIDGRLPSTEDGCSWPALLTNYRPDHIDGDFLFLKRDVGPTAALSLPVLSGTKRSLGDIILLPKTHKPIYAMVDVRPTWVGRIVNILFKPSPLIITFNMTNGEMINYRLISGMANSGFLISPLIQNTVEFALLYGGVANLASGSVESFTIQPVAFGSLWEKEFNVILEEVIFPPAEEVWKFQVFDDIDKDLSGSSISDAPKCDGSIDSVNGRPAPAKLSGQILDIRGWLAGSVEKPTLPEAVFVVLSDTAGHHIFWKTRRVARPDVGAHLKKSSLDSSGYESRINLSGLGGQYILGLAYKEGERIKACPQFKFPINLKNNESASAPPF
jgi:hypothetical protein